MTESSGAKITAFHGIFETKLKGLLKDIKKLRKDPSKKERLKNIIQEAKQLKRMLKTEKLNKKNHVVQIPMEVVDGGVLMYLNDIDSTMGVEVVNATFENGVLVLELYSK